MSGVPPNYVMPDYRMTVRFAFSFPDSMHFKKEKREAGNHETSTLSTRWAMPGTILAKGIWNNLMWASAKGDRIQ
jgi:hypothetical protein